MGALLLPNSGKLTCRASVGFPAFMCILYHLSKVIDKSIKIHFKWNKICNRNTLLKYFTQHCPLRYVGPTGRLKTRDHQNGGDWHRETQLHGETLQRGTRSDRGGQFCNCLRTVEPTPSYTSVGVDYWNPATDASSKSAIAHHVGVNCGTSCCLYFLEHFYVQFGRLSRHQRVTHWKREISGDKQSKQLIMNRRHHFEHCVKV